MDFLVAAIRRRVRIKSIDTNGGPPPTLIPADPTTLAHDEGQFGFAFPELLKRIYVEIGNGGFGPGYGLIGLTGGVPDDLGRTALTIYRGLREGSPSEPGWHWPPGLLPICHWGCAILSCIDCTNLDFTMQVFDPNVYDGKDWTGAFFGQSAGFEAWMRAWADGLKLWDAMYGDTGNPFRISNPRRTHF